jgi:probable HAF family extracellular repeat protein
MHDLGTLSGYTQSWAYGINNSGQIVGYCAAWDEYKEDAAFLYTNGTMVKLNSLLTGASAVGWDLRVAYSINDSGQIVGYGVKNYLGHGFILTPVPEPSTVALLLTACLGGLLWWRRT